MGAEGGNQARIRAIGTQKKPRNRGEYAMPAVDYPPLTLEIMDMVGDKWTLLVVYILGDGALRFSELRRRAAPVSQKMLTQTLRALERHAMVERTVLPTAPPQVEYALTGLGRSFLAAAG